MPGEVLLRIELWEGALIRPIHQAIHTHSNQTANDENRPNQGIIAPRRHQHKADQILREGRKNRMKIYELNNTSVTPIHYTKLFILYYKP